MKYGVCGSSDSLFVKQIIIFTWLIIRKNFFYLILFTLVKQI